MSATLEDLATDADLKARRQAQRRQELSERFASIARGKAWFDGTGQDDAIMPHQWKAMCFGAVAKRFLLADGMGLGKTRSSVGWMDLVGARRVILVAEKNIAGQFAGEVMDLAPYREIVMLAGLDKKKRHERIAGLLKHRKNAVVVINYEMFRQDAESLNNLLRWQADTVIVDEAHNMKSASSSNFRIVKKLLFTDNKCERCGGLITTLSKPCPACRYMRLTETPTERRAILEHYLATKSVQNVALMTGTPLLNTPLDLYSLLHLIDPSKFPTETGFRKAFLKPSYIDGSRKMVFKRDGLKQLHPYIKNFYLARTAEDIGERVEGGLKLPGGRFLPDQKHRIIRVELDRDKYPLQARTIEQVSKQARIMLSTGEKATLMHIITVILRKRQANVWPGGITFKDQESGEVIFSVGKEVQESCKMDACQEQILAYHEQGHRQVVFSQFKEALKEFEQRIRAAGLRVVRFDGDTKDADRNAIKSNFYKAKGEAAKWDVVLVHYRAGGAGLNLTSATITHVLDEEWNAGRRDQAFGRTHRIGQDEPTEVLTYRIPGTVDTWMANLISTKERMANDLHSTMTNKELIGRIGDAILKGEM